MNVLFICSLSDVQSPTKPLQKPEEMQLGISYISAFLKKHGYHTKLLVLDGTLDKGNKNIINGYFTKFYPKLICFTAVATEYHSVKDIAKYIKSNYPDIYLLIGGPHVSLNPEEALSDDFDALCIGEGEDPALELVSQLEKGISPSGIPNLWIKHEFKIEKNSPRPFLQNLDSLPFPDREMWQEWIENPGLRYSVLLGRGCPFQCTYCCNHALKKLASGAYVRFRSPDNIIEEIKEIVDKFLTEREIYLEIETIGVNKKWAVELCSKLEQLNKTLSQPLSFGVNMRVTRNADFNDLFAAFKRSNFHFINIGLESGSDRVRREILKRDYSNQDIINTVALARKYGLKVALNNMIGFPGETLEDFKKTVEINRTCLPDWCNTYIFIPYPGTDLHSLCKKQGLLKGPLDAEMERRKATLDIPGFPKKQIQKSYVWFAYYVYKGHKPIYKILAIVLRSKLHSKYYLNYFYRLITRLGFIKRLVNVLKRH
jgi:anaerobic magnesium-protoporphyrin IX monomethyl ester cyclase